MVGLVVCCETSACLVSVLTSVTAPLSAVAVQRAYVERRTRLSDAVIPNHSTTPAVT